MPTILIAGLRGQAEDSWYDQNESINYEPAAGIDIPELITSKEVTDKGNGTFGVKLTSYTTAEYLTQPNTDIMLVLDMSTRMNDPLYTRGKTNLNTHTLFKEESIRNVSHNELFDKTNPYNTNALFTINDKYANNKYVEDPTHPGVYIYLAQTFTCATITDWNNHYSYTFTDSEGTVYESDTFDQFIGRAIIAAITNGDILDLDTYPINEGTTLNPKYQITFHKKNNPSEKIVINSFYYRCDEEGNRIDEDYVSAEDLSAIANTSNGGPGLYIRDDNGNYIQVHVDETYATATSGSGAGQTYVSKYTFWYTDINGNRQEMVLGNAIYGAKNSVFQGFKAYERVVDPNTNKVTYRAIHQDGTLESKSLYSGEQESVTRLQALKESVEYFLIEIHKDAYQNGGKERVGISTYSGTAKTPFTLDAVDMSECAEVHTMIDKVYNFTAEESSIITNREYTSRIDLGMTAAQTELAKSQYADDKKIAIAFSAGVPSAYGQLHLFGTIYDPRDFCTEVADKAISTAYEMKNDLGASIYTVGLFSFADEQQLYGNKFYYAGGEEGNWYPNTPCDGSVGQMWGSTVWGNLLHASDITPTDAAATNRFLNYLSSDFTSPQELGLTRGRFNPGWSVFRRIQYLLSLGGTGYRIDKNYTRADTGYYFDINTNQDSEAEGEEQQTYTDAQIEDRMKEVFREVASKAKVADSVLGPTAEMIDTVTEYFDIIDTTESPIRAYSIDANDVETGDTYTVTRNDQKLTVSGFDYSKHNQTGYYTVDGQSVPGEPQKLVLEFDIQTKPGFIGGNKIPTNMANSGVYDSEHRMEELFNVPYVNVDVDVDVLTEDQSIYVGQNVDLRDLVNELAVNGTNNEFVNIVYEIYDNEQMTGTPINTYRVEAGESEGVWTNENTATQNVNNPTHWETTEYYVRATVTPITPGTVDEEIASANPAVYVFTPVITEHNDYVEEGTRVNLIPTAPKPEDEEEPGGEEPGDEEPGDEEPTEEKPVDWNTLTWQCVDNSSAKTPVGDAPELYYYIENKTDGVTWNTSVAADLAAAKDFTIDENHDFQITKVVVAAHTNTYEYTTTEQEQVPIYDENGNQTGTETVDVEVTYQVNQQIAARELIRANNEVEFNNTSDDDKEGNFWIKVTIHEYAAFLSKEFKGDYAVPETITFSVVEQSDPSTVVTSGTINADDFTTLKYENLSLGNLEYGKTYVLSESYASSSDYTPSYSGVFKADDKPDQTVSDGDQVEATYTFTINKTDLDETGTVYITVVNTMKEEAYPVITGVSEESKSGNVLLIAILATVAVGAGGYGVYRVYKPRKEEGSAN